jgi:uncharacterized membrane protein
MKVLPGSRARPESRQSIWERVRYATYGLALAVSISLWFTAIRTPLWLDETVSYWQISAGLTKVWSREHVLVPAYPYILSLASKILGTGEIALRVPSILAMLAAAYLLYRTARDLFDRDIALLTAAVFCIHPVVTFASIDARPYAFGALAITAAFFLLVRLRRSDSNWLAAAFGVSAAVICYFHLLFGTLLPALLIGFFAIKRGVRSPQSEQRSRTPAVSATWRQFGIALAAFAVAFLPVIRGLLYIVRTSGSHVWDQAPTLSELGLTLAPLTSSFVLAGALFAATASRRLNLQSRVEGGRLLLCASLALIPILILFGVSVGTSLHVFTDRYRLVAVPGIALLWGLVFSRIDSRLIRMLACVALVTGAAYQYFTSPQAKYHGYTWKYALETVEKNASVDNAPVLICSDLPESNSMPIPSADAVKDSVLFAPLSYYKLSVPVVGLPRALNDETVRIASAFLENAARRHQRFFAVEYANYFETLTWIARNAAATHNVHVLEGSYGIAILEFTPRD